MVARGLTANGLLLAALLAGAGSGCGAKTGLTVPDFDAAHDAEPAEDVFVRFDACVAGRFTMVRRSAEMLFVVDRSGSMSEQLEAGMMRTRWEAMRLALYNTLPMFDRYVDMGVYFFPRVPVTGALGNQQFCMLTPGNTIDVHPARNNAMRVIEAVYRATTSGATPTGPALETARRFLASREARGRARYLVLATDGAPNCNERLNGATCVCLQGPGMCSSGATAARWCLDDQGTVDQIAAAARDGIFTYVIGMDGDIPEEFTNVLDRMAEAGGRANPTSPRYISIRSASALTESFRTIQQTVTRCSFVTPSRPDDPDAITITAGGRSIPRDTTHMEGWDWSDRDYGEVALYGQACALVLAENAALSAEVACRTR